MTKRYSLQALILLTAAAISLAATLDRTPRTGTKPGEGPETREELGRLLALSSETLSRLVLRAAEMLEEKDLAFDHGYVYRVDGGIG